MAGDASQIVNDFAGFIEEFKDESDRAIVVLTAAKLDYLLLCVLQKHLVPNTSKDDEFFEKQGPGSTFSSKIMLAYRLGLIDKDMTRSLNLVRKVRNDFAHEASGCSLEKGSHKDRVRALSAPYRKYPAYQEFKKDFFKGIPRSRSDYMTVTGFLILRLGYLFESLEPVAEENAWRVITSSMRDWKPETEQLAAGDSESRAEGAASKTPES